MSFTKAIGIPLPSFLSIQSGIGLAIFLCCPPPGKAEEYHGVIQPYASASMRYDSNVFGLPDERAARALGLNSLSDSSRTTRVGVRIDKEVSRQVLSADLSVNALRFNRYAFLDTDGHDFKGNWNWHAGKSLEGDIGVNATRGLATFLSFNQPVKNIRTQNSRYASLVWRPHPRWQASARYAISEIEYDLPEISLSKRTENKSTFEVNYVTPSSNTFGIQAVHTTGNVPTSSIGGIRFGEDNFVQDALKAKLDWHLTDKTDIHLLAGPVNRRQESRIAGDYTGADLRVGAIYRYSAKTNVAVSAWQEVGIADDSTTLYSRNRGVSVMPSWKITEKTSLQAEWRREQRDFSHSAAFIGQNSEQLNYVLNTASLGIAYHVTNRVLLQPSFFVVSKDGYSSASSFIRRGGLVTLQYHY